LVAGVEVDVGVDEVVDVDELPEVDDVEVDEVDEDEDDEPEVPLESPPVVLVRRGGSVVLLWPPTDDVAPPMASTGKTGCSETSLSAASTARHATKVAAAVTNNHSRARPRRRIPTVFHLAVATMSKDYQALVKRPWQSASRL
jgi:hypothetical protein